MKRALALLSLVVLSIICFTCKKEPEVPVAQVKITEVEKVFESYDGHISATFKGTYAYVGTIKGITLQIGTEEDMSSPTSEEAQIDETTFTVRVDGLTAETKYYYRYAVDYGGAKDYETEVKDFVTPALPLPMVTTAEVTEYTGTTAICGGTVTNTSGMEVTERGVCWSTDHNPTIEGDHKASSDEGNSFTVNVSDLSPETTYYVRAYAVNEAGVGYGSEVSFATSQVHGFVVAVSANPSEGGTVSGGGEYSLGDECTVTASPNEGYTFANWTENDVQVCDVSNYTFAVTGSRTLVAQFHANSYTISVSADPAEGGTVSGGGDFHYGEECTLTATPASGYRFVNWTKGDEVVYGESAYMFQVTETASYVAHFQVMAFDLSVTANPTVIPKGGNSQLDAVASGGSGSFTYSWTPSSSLNNASIHNPTATPTATTTYTCTVTSGGQTGSGSCTVAVVCPPANLTAEVQNSNNVHLSWTAANPADSYKVYRDNALVASITATTYTDSNLGAGTYNYQVSAVYQDVESPKSYTAQSTIYNSLSVTATATPSTIPEGGSSTLMANATGGNGSYTYDWTPTTGLNNSHVQSPTATPSSTTTYTVTVGCNGQSAIATVTVNVVRAPTGLTATVQNNNNVLLSWTAANPADSYKVYRDNTLIASNITSATYTDSGLSAGTYSYQVSVVYQGVESPKSNAASATINSSLSVTATATPSIIPQGNSSTLTATATGGNGSYTYSWSPTTGLNNSHIQSPTATPSSSTTYTVTVSSSGQTATATVTVNVVRAPTSLTATVQNTNNVHLTWNAANPATSYKVYRNNAVIASNVTSTSYNDNGLGSGTYSYQVSTVYQGVESPKSNSASVTIESGSWLYYGGDNNQSVFSGGSSQKQWAVMFPPSVLSPYPNASITKVKCYNYALGPYTLRIYSGNATSATNNILYSTTINVTSLGWQEFSIPTVSLSSVQYLWVSLSYPNNPSGLCQTFSAGVNNPNARWVFDYYGENFVLQWYDGFYDGYGSLAGDFCHMIRVYVTNSTKGEGDIEIELPQEP